MANVFDYTDYREFLRDVYRENKARNRAYSCRFIAAKVGFRSASFFSQILKGRSNISPAMAARFAAFLRLKRKEAEFFETLVRFNQAKAHEEKQRAFEGLMAFRGSKVRILDAGDYEFYEKWYYTAIRELLYFKPFRGDYEDLARTLVPPIRPSEARQAVDVLLRLGMIKRTPQGRLARADAVSSSTGYEARDVAIRSFQLQTLALAADALDRIPREARSISTLTLSLSRRGYLALEEELAGFRRRLLKMAEEDEREDTVYQVNFQVFPLTKPALPAPAPASGTAPGRPA